MSWCSFCARDRSSGSGTGEDIPLQLAVAQRVLRIVEGEADYVDVSVPERAVVG